MRNNDNRFPVSVEGRTVKVEDSANGFNRALRQFNRRVQDSGVVKECRERMYYEKPSVTKQKQKKAAHKRWQKHVSQMQPTKRK